MSFQAYLDNIEVKTGKSPQHFIDEAAQKGFSKSTKAGEMIQWLADEYNLGRGHAMALIHVIKNGAKIADTHVNSNRTHNDLSNTLKLDGADALSLIGSPARSALREIGVTKASQLIHHTEKDLLAIHGVGPKAIRILREAHVSLREE
jgi:predicted Fe-Mo cluster-binding NifX family protein